MRRVYRAAGLVLIALVTPVAFAQAQGSLERWVTANTSPTEELVCKRDVEGDYFFVARAEGGRIRLGLRFDLTKFRDTHSFSYRWKLTNERGESIANNILPTSLRSEYGTVDGKTYANNVEYQNVRRGAREMRVEVRVDKCPARDCESKAAERSYVLDLCVAHL